MERNNNLKWLCFLGLPDDYPIWSTRFQVFAQTKGLFDTLTGYERPPNPPRRLGDQPSDEERKEQAEHPSEPLLNAMVLNGLPERYEHFVVQESLNATGSFVELRTIVVEVGADQVGGVGDPHVLR